MTLPGLREGLEIIKVGAKTGELFLNSPWNGTCVSVAEFDYAGVLNVKPAEGYEFKPTGSYNTYEIVKKKQKYVTITFPMPEEFDEQKPDITVFYDTKYTGRREGLRNVEYTVTEQ